MLGHDFDADKRLDENLRAIAPRLPLPATPTNEQRRRWTSAPDGGSHSTRINKGTLYMKRYGLFTLTAAAAAVFFAAFALWPSGPAPVQARTILNSLASAAHRGIRVECRNLSQDGARVDLALALLFDREVSITQLIDESQDDPSCAIPSALHLRADIAVDEGVEDLGGLKLALQGVFTESDAWVWLRVPELPQGLLEQAPPLALFQGSLRAGMLFDFSHLEDLGLDLDEEIENGLRIDAFANASADDEEHSGITLNVEANTDADGDPHGSVDVGAQMNFDEEFLKLRGFLTGEAGRDQIEALIEDLQSHAESATVTHRDDGVWILTVENVIDEDEELHNARIEIAYAEGRGVEWLEISRLGTTRGVVRIEWIDALRDSDKLSKDALLSDGATQLIDVANMIESFKALGLNFELQKEHE